MYDTPKLAVRRACMRLSWASRTLTDNVTSARLSMLSNGKITSDHMAPHTDLLPHFPYLGMPPVQSQ